MWNSALTPSTDDADVAADVAEAGPLDLDDLGALVGRAARPRTGPVSRDRQVEDPDSGAAVRSRRRVLAHASNSSLLRGRPPGPL